MRTNESFDNNFFLKIICVISALALVFIIAVSIVGLVSRDAPTKSDDNAETFIFGSTETTPSEPQTGDTEPNDTDATDTESDNSYASDESDETTSETEDAPSTEEETTVISDDPTLPATGMLGESEDAGDEYISRLTFLGDSTTYGLKAYKMLENGKNTKQVWTSSSASLSLNKILEKKIIYPETGEEMTIPEAAEKAKPEYLVITLGVEGVTFLDEEGFKEQYTSLVDAVKTASPETKIILQSIFPVNSEIFSNKDKLCNELIDKANGWVLEVAESMGVWFLDTASVLKDEDGGLNSKYDNGGNGINLNDTGFTAVLSYIKTHALS